MIIQYLIDRQLFFVSANDWCPDSFHLKIWGLNQRFPKYYLTFLRILCVFNSRFLVEHSTNQMLMHNHLALKDENSVKES